MATEVKFETNISEILEKAKELKATAEQTTYKNNISELERMQDRMRDLFKNMTSPEMSQFTDGLVESFNEILAQTHGIGTSLNNMFDGLDLNQVEIAQTHFRELQQVIVSAMTTLKDGGKEGTNEYKELASALTHVNNALSNLKVVDTNISLEEMSRLTKGNTTRMQDFANSMRKVFGASKQMESGIKSSTRSFNIGGVSVKRFMGSLVGVQSAYSFLSRATRQYINSHSAMSSSLQGITVGFGELLAPAINYVIRGLQTLVRWVMIAIAYIQTFINVIFGTSFAIRYVIKDTSDLNKGLGGLGKSAKKGSKAVQKEMKKMLAPFDELNVISKDTDDNLGDMGSSGVGGGVGGGVAPDMSPFDITDQMGAIQRFNTFLEKHKGLIKAITIAVGALLAAWAGFKIIKTITGWFGGLMRIVKFSPWVVAIGLVIGAIYLMWKHWDTIKEIAGIVFNAIGNGLSWVLGKISSFVSFVWELVKGLIGFIWSLFRTTGDIMVAPFLFLWDTVSDMFSSMIEFIRITWETIELIIWEVIKFVVVLVKEWVVAMRDTLVLFVEVFKTLFTSAWEHFKNIFNTMLELGKLTFKTIGDFVRDYFNVFKAVFDMVRDVGLAVWKTIRDFVVDVFKALTGQGVSFKDILTNLWNNIKNIFGTTFEGIKNIAMSVFETIKNLGRNMGEGLKLVWNGIKNSFSIAFNSIKNIFGSVWDWIIGRFAQGGKIFNAFKDGVLSVFKVIVNALIRGINVVIGTPFRTLNNALNKFKNISILGKKPFGFIPNIPVPNIPQLATGNVATEPLHAIFGEYTGAKHNPEITTPQRTMERSFAKELDKREPRNEGGDLHIEVNVDGKRSITETVKDYNQYKRRGGKLSFGID